MDLAFVNKLARDNNGVIYLLARTARHVWQDNGRTRNEDEGFERNSKGIFENDYETKPTQKFWVDRGTEFAGEFKKHCAGAGIEIYSTMSKRKVAFAERTISSLKNIMYRYMEDHGYKYFHKLPQFVTKLNSRLNCTVGIKPKKVENSDFMSVFYGQPIREFKQPKFTVANKVRISKIDLHFRKGYKPQFTDEVFQIVAIASRKPPTYTIMDDQNLIIRGNFYEKELMLVI